jgi:hypothetical protein
VLSCLHMQIKILPSGHLRRGIQFDTVSSSFDFHIQRKANDTREVTGFKLRVPAPTDQRSYMCVEIVSISPGRLIPRLLELQPCQRKRRLISRKARCTSLWNLKCNTRRPTENPIVLSISHRAKRASRILS